MTKFKLLSVFICILFTSFSSLAQMYKWVDENGEISYSDQPPYKGAEELEAPALSTMPATTIPEKKQPATEEEEDQAKEVAKYTLLTINSPKNDDYIRDSGGNLSVSFSVKPELDKSHGHYFSVSMDGKIVKNKLTSNSASFNNVERGTHKISVSVKNKQGKTFRKSKTISFYLHQQTAIRRRAR